MTEKEYALMELTEGLSIHWFGEMKMLAYDEQSRTMVDITDEHGRVLKKYLPK